MKCSLPHVCTAQRVIVHRVSELSLLSTCAYGSCVRAATKVNTWKLHLHFWAIPSHPGIFKDGILKLCPRLKFVFHCFSLSWPLLLLLWLLVAGGKSLILWARSVVDHSFQRSPFPAIKGKISPLKLQLIAKAQFVVLLKMLWNELLRNCARKCLITVM